MKKLIIIAMAIMLVFGAVGCQNSNPLTDPTNPMNPANPNSPLNPNNPNNPSYDDGSVDEDELVTEIDEATDGTTLKLKGTYSITGATSLNAGIVFEGADDAVLSINGTANDGDGGYIQIPETTSGVSFNNVEIKIEGTSRDYAVNAFGTGLKFTNSKLTGNGNTIFGIALNVAAQNTTIQNVEMNGFLDAGINVSTNTVTITGCSGTSGIMIDIPYSDTMKIENNTCPIYILKSVATDEAIATLKEKNPEATVLSISTTPSLGSIASGGDINTALGTKDEAYLAADGEYTVSSALNLEGGKSIIGQEGSKITLSNKISTTQDGNITEPLTISGVDIDVTGENKDAPAINSYPALILEDSTINATDTTTIAVAVTT